MQQQHFDLSDRPPTARSVHTPRSHAGRSDAGSLAPPQAPPINVISPLGTFLGTAASDDAKAMWSTYRTQLHSRSFGDAPPSLGLASAAGEATQRLGSAPPLPKPGGPDDPGRMVKDWAWYSYHPRASLKCSLNQFGTSMNNRWPGLNHTPLTRHHLILRPGSVGAVRELPQTVWTGHPSLEAGPGEKGVVRKLKRDEQERRRHILAVERHREVQRKQLVSRAESRSHLQMMSSQPL